jgi:leucyl aminopeptidase
MMAAMSLSPDELPAEPAQVYLAAGVLARGLDADADPLDVHDLTGVRLTAFIEGLILGSYRFGTEAALPVGLSDVRDPHALQAGLRRAAATVWARELANTRANVKDPAWLGATAQRVLTPLGVEVQVHDPEWLAANGFGGVLAVGAGSSSPPRLIEARWRPRGARAEAHVVLVGKGITYDTGGIDRKPGSAMNTMYTDMAGGAAVLGAVRSLAAARVPIRVTALVAAAENAFSGAAYRPSDVVRHVGGRTSEITNTDAEGRLVLADALAYAVARLGPSAMVDIATLTGAMKIALGLRTAGVFATDDDLAADLVEAGAATGEPLWRLPMPVEYEPLLRSDVADAVNAPGNPGAITAALFLRPFAGDVPWAHLDVAGPARAAKDEGVLSRGATGFGTRLLSAWVESMA